MDTWAWLTIIGIVAVILFALAWRSSGRAPIRGRGPDTSLTPSQVERISQSQIGNNGFPSGFAG